MFGPISIRWFAVSVAIATIGGCEKATRPVVGVAGTIAFSDGRPLPGGTRLMFNPGDGKTESGVAVVGSDGSFDAHRASGRKGLEVGKYTVLLRAPEGDTAFFKSVPSDYYDGGVLDAEVKEGMAPLAFKVVVRKR